MYRMYGTPRAQDAQERGLAPITATSIMTRTQTMVLR